ncbi:MAG: hypothetical protein K1060chlam1_00932 [Candidatus Anoxychlamydiales bacterium]|nr:hypothetical protein [Candidatus Anoxychlamydiales bacterium]
MKNVMKIIIGLLITSSAYAQDEKENYFKKDNSTKTTYVRFGTSAMRVDESYEILPGITAGWQYRENRQGVDISASGFKSDKDSQEALSYTLPKVQYLAFLQDNKPSNKHNAYFGLGASLFGMIVEQEKKDEDDYSFFERVKEYSNSRKIFALYEKNAFFNFLFVNIFENQKNP